MRCDALIQYSEHNRVIWEITLPLHLNLPPFSIHFEDSQSKYILDTECPWGKFKHFSCKYIKFLQKHDTTKEGLESLNEKI